MNQRELRCFLQVAKTQNFTIAAQQLFMTQPAVSAQITNLERELGVSLFQRGYHEVKLTYAGEVLLPTARKVITGFDQMTLAVTSLKQDQYDGQPATLRMGLYFATPLNAILDLIHLFTVQYPSIQVTTDAYYGGAALTALRHHDIDIALGLVTPKADVTWVPIMDDELVVLRSEEYVAATQTTIDLATLTDKLLINLPSSADDDFSQRQATLLGQPTNQLTVHSMAAALMNLTCSDAYMVVPRRAVSELQHIRALRIAAAPTTLTQFKIGFAYLTANHATATDVFAQFTKLVNA